MGKDYPDWGTYSGEYKDSPVRDLGELAVRLGSPYIFSKSGNVLLIEDFSLGTGRWDKFSLGAGVLPTIQSDYWLNGGFACIMDPGTPAGGLSRITKGISGYPDSPLGLEIAFSLRSYCILLLYIQQWHGGVIKNYIARFTYGVASKLEVYHSDATWHVVIDNPILQAGRNLFHFLKFVWYPAAGRYAWLQLDNIMVTDIAWLPQVGLTGNQWQFFTYLQAESVGQPNCDINIDHVIFTYNEPL